MITLSKCQYYAFQKIMEPKFRSRCDNGEVMVRKSNGNSESFVNFVYQIAVGYHSQLSSPLCQQSILAAISHFNRNIITLISHVRTRTRENLSQKYSKGALVELKIFFLQPPGLNTAILV